MQHPYLVSAVIDGDLVALANPPHLGRWIGSVKVFHVQLFAENFSLDLKITPYGVKYTISWPWKLSNSLTSTVSTMGSSESLSARISRPLGSEMMGGKVVGHTSSQASWNGVGCCLDTCEFMSLGQHNIFLPMVLHARQICVKTVRGHP